MRDVRGCFFRMILLSKVAILGSFFSVDMNGIVGVYFMNTCEKLFSVAKFCFLSLGHNGARRGATGATGHNWV